MPSRKVHKLIDRLLLGREYEYVHKFKDYPSKFLGPRHRVLFHDLLTDVAIGLLTRDPKALASAVLHDLTDIVHSRAKRELRNIGRSKRNKRTVRRNRRKRKASTRSVKRSRTSKVCR